VNESNQNEITLTALAARVKTLEETVDALCAASNVPRGRFHINGIKGIERRAGVEPSPTAVPVDFSGITGATVILPGNRT